MRASEAGNMVGIVADDLTGANDASVHFAGAGWQVRIALGAPPDETSEPSSAIVVVSDARALDGPAARASTARAVRDVARSGAERLFLKIDSTMRGSVPDQVIGALEGWAPGHPGSFALVCPAYPSMGRTLSGGRVLVDGAEVDTTEAGRDPVTPVASSSMGELIPGSVNIAQRRRRHRCRDGRRYGCHRPGRRCPGRQSSSGWIGRTRLRVVHGMGNNQKRGEPETPYCRATRYRPTRCRLCRSHRELAAPCFACSVPDACRIFAGKRRPGA
jgi:hypothetical protein